MKNKDKYNLTEIDYYFNYHYGKDNDFCIWNKNTHTIIYRTVIKGSDKKEKASNLFAKWLESESEND